MTQPDRWRLARALFVLVLVFTVRCAIGVAHCEERFPCVRPDCSALTVQAAPSPAPSPAIGPPAPTASNPVPGFDTTPNAWTWQRIGTTFLEIAGPAAADIVSTEYALGNCPASKVVTAATPGQTSFELNPLGQTRARRITVKVVMAAVLTSLSQWLESHGHESGANSLKWIAMAAQLTLSASNVAIANGC